MEMGLNYFLEADVLVALLDHPEASRANRTHPWVPASDDSPRLELTVTDKRDHLAMITVFCASRWVPPAGLPVDSRPLQPVLREDSLWVPFYEQSEAIGNSVTTVTVPGSAVIVTLVWTRSYRLAGFILHDGQRRVAKHFLH